MVNSRNKADIVRMTAQNSMKLIKLYSHDDQERATDRYNLEYT
jgi:hypothetical protein